MAPMLPGGMLPGMSNALGAAGMGMGGNMGGTMGGSVGGNMGDMGGMQGAYANTLAATSGAMNMGGGMQQQQGHMMQHTGQPQQGHKRGPPGAVHGAWSMACCDALLVHSWCIRVYVCMEYVCRESMYNTSELTQPTTISKQIRKQQNNTNTGRPRPPKGHPHLRPRPPAAAPRPPAAGPIPPVDPEVARKAQQEKLQKLQELKMLMDEQNKVNAELRQRQAADMEQHEVWGGGGVCGCGCSVCNVHGHMGVMFVVFVLCVCACSIQRQQWIFPPTHIHTLTTHT